jgi:quinol monooxygenase YgiN
VSQTPPQDATPEVTLVTMAFDSADPDRLLPVLANYVVVSRGQLGCRNMDLCASLTVPGRIVVVQKWASLAAQRAHFDSPAMVEMAESCRPLLRSAPAIDLLAGLSAHDLD